MKTFVKIAVAFMLQLSATGSEVQKATLNELDLDSNPEVVTNVTFEGLATHEYVVNQISTGNPAFVEAVTNSAVIIANTSEQEGGDDGFPVGDWSQYVTIGAILAAFSAAITWLRNKANATETELSGKADDSDLPYRLVEPGKWEYEPLVQLTNFAVTSSPEYFSGYWTASYFSEETGNETLQAEGDADALSLDFAAFLSTRASPPGHLLDRAGNRVVVSGDTTLTLPAAVPGYLRDFLVRLEISGSTVPTITFASPTGEAITYETDGDEFPVPDEAGTWLYSFTETAAHKFAVSLKKVNEVLQGGA